MSRSRGNPRGEEWFEDLFRRHHAAVRGYCLRRVARDADDLVAEVFTIAWRKRASIPDRPLPWLYSVAAREVLHRHRGEGRRIAYEQQAAAREHEPLDAFMQADARLDARAPVTTALDRLRPADAEILRLWAWEELSAPEIATVLGISSATARVRLHRARLRMEAQLRAVGLPAAEEPDRPTSSAFETLEPCHD